MTGGGDKDSPAHGKARTWNGRYVNIAHRRTPSELTPLIQQNLALQQQVELLTAQNQHMMHQQSLQQQQGQAQQPIQQSLLPPPPVFHSHTNSHAPASPSSPLHTRQRSMGHARRHSLAVSEAKKYAQERSTVNNAPTTPLLTQLAPPPALPSPSAFGSPGPIETPQFRFPPSPERARTHSRSQSMSSFRKQTPSPQRFQFPPADQQQTGYQPSHLGHPQGQQGHLGHQMHPSGQQTHLGHQSHPSGHQLHTQYGHAQRNSQWEGHRPRPSNASDFSPSSGRKSLFVPYLPQAAIPEMLSEGLLVTGTLRVNHKNRSYAYVSTDLLDADVLIDGSKDRNRALEGDFVAVELLDVDDVWEQKREKEERKRRREGGGSAEASADPSEFGNTGGATGLRRKGSLRQRPPQKRSDDVEVEGQTLLLRDELGQGDEKPLYCGHVVAILERPAGQLFSGTLGLLRPSSQATKERQMHSRSASTSGASGANSNSTGIGAGTVEDTPPVAPKIVWFKPTDKCVPLMAIPTEQAPPDLVENPQAYVDRIFVGQIKRWPITSLHPFGTLVETLGHAGQPEVTQRAVLRDFNFGPHVFSEAAIAEAKLVGEAMQAAKLPLFPHRVVKLAPDLAASITGNTLAVHVLDLTPFVPKNGQLDRELRHKSAGVYMQGYESPLMAPEAQKFVELQVGRQSPVLTVLIGLETGSVEVKHHMVQPDPFMLPSSDATQSPSANSTNASSNTSSTASTSSTSDTTNTTGTASTSNTSITTTSTDNEIWTGFANAASVLRRRRGLSCIDDKSVDLSSLLDVCVPARAPLSPPSRNELIVNEIVHAANAVVASELLRSQQVGLNAIVRRQSEPSVARLEQLADMLRSRGIRADTSSAQALARSLAEELPFRKACAVKALLAKLLSRQRYAVAARTDPGQLGHYWFGFDAYTHFARPLLRYADQVVARQVHLMLDSKPAENAREADVSVLGAPGGLAISSETPTSPVTPLTPDGAGATTPPASAPTNTNKPAFGANTTGTSDYTHLMPELSFRYDCARSVQEQSAHLVLANSLSTEYQLVSGIVVAVYESAFDVVVPEMSVEKRVHGDQLPLTKAEFYPKENKLELFWNKGADTAKYSADGQEEQTKPQPNIPADLRAALVLKQPCVQEITPLCEVPILIRVSKGGSVLPSIMVRAANPYV